MSEFATYRQFFSAEEAKPLIALLNEHGIPYTFTPIRARFDNIIVGESINESFELKVPATEFDHVTSLQLANTTVNIDLLDKDYYMLSFSEDELYNVIKNPDEWSVQDYLIAVELLKRRGKVFTREKLQELRTKKIETLATPEKKLAAGWLILAYGIPLWAGLTVWFPYPSFARLWPAFLGTLWGVTLWKFKKLLPDGRRVYIYQASDRAHGKRIFFIGLAALISVMIGIIYWSH
jgi:hypothetical protein